MMRHLVALKDEVARWKGMAQRAADLDGLLALAMADGDEAMGHEISAETEKLAGELEPLEFRLLLSGEYDERDAILAIHAGAGGTESQDWAEMLLRMYLRWAESHGYATSILDTTPGEEAGLKSVMVEIDGTYAYGYLKAERGVHRLVRLSPFDAAHRRHTSFALVEVMPVIEDAIEVKVNPDDLRIDVFRASGHGGCVSLTSRRASSFRARTSGRSFRTKRRQ
jgi:peptide chain release factor 2